MASVPESGVREGNTAVVYNPIFTDNEFKREEQALEVESSQPDESFDATNNYLMSQGLS